jgi:hypothetical protein
MISREEARLRALFQRLLIASAAAASASCSSSSASAPDAGQEPGAERDSGASSGGGDAGDATISGDDAGLDATTATDASGDDGGAANDASDDDVWGYVDAACFPGGYDADPEQPCVFYATLPCGVPPNTPVSLCHLLVHDCAILCGQGDAGKPCDIVECVNEDAGAEASVPSGPVTLECSTGKVGCGPGPGRRPAGLAPAPPRAARDVVGAWLADAARLEAASVDAFRRLARELAARGAPRALVRAAERSARDEIRHARVTTRLARRRGAHPAPVAIERPAASRSLEAIAVENAVEGCVRESFAALFATHQASHAASADLAREMRRIARDETRHAALAWSVSGWVRSRLSPDERARVASAMRAAIADLRREARRVPEELGREVGLAHGEAAAALVDAFAEHVEARARLS